MNRVATFPRKTARRPAKAMPEPYSLGEVYGLAMLDVHAVELIAERWGYSAIAGALLPLLGSGEDRSTPIVADRAQGFRGLATM